MYFESICFGKLSKNKTKTKRYAIDRSNRRSVVMECTHYFQTILFMIQKERNKDGMSRRDSYKEFIMSKERNYLEVPEKPTVLI